jgi:threonine dehydrogenase-like Zn-dependent dehydrogenase
MASATQKLDRYQRFEYEIPKRTLVWQLTGKGFENFHLEEIPVPAMGPKDILFRSDSNGICFSDVKVVSSGPEHPRLQGYDMVKDKVVPGHEISITVVAVGKEADPTIRVGDRFIVQADMLEYDTAVGYAIWGGMIQYGVFDPRVQKYLIRIGRAETGYSQASLVEPWACIEASYYRADINDTDRVVWVLGGGGPMGQMHILRTLSLAAHGKLPGLEAVIITDLSEERLEATRRRYAEIAGRGNVEVVAVDPRTPAFRAALDRLSPNGVDYIVACAPSAEIVNDSRKHLKRYGVLNLFAGLKRGTGVLNLGDIHYDQHTITGNSGSRVDDMKRVLELTEKGELDTNFSAGAVVGMKAGRDGVKAVADGTITNKTILYPQLPDLPLTRIEDLPAIVEFSPEVKAEVLQGRWSTRAEKEMLDALLPV